MDLGPSAAHCAIFAPSGPGSGAKFVQKALIFGVHLSRSTFQDLPSDVPQLSRMD